MMIVDEKTLIPWHVLCYWVTNLKMVAIKSFLENTPVEFRLEVPNLMFFVDQVTRNIDEGINTKRKRPQIEMVRFMAGWGNDFDHCNMAVQNDEFHPASLRSTITWLIFVEYARRRWYLDFEFPNLDNEGVWDHEDYRLAWDMVPTETLEKLIDNMAGNTLSHWGIQIEKILIEKDYERLSEMDHVIAEVIESRKDKENQ